MFHPDKFVEQSQNHSHGDACDHYDVQILSPEVYTQPGSSLRVQSPALRQPVNLSLYRQLPSLHSTHIALIQDAAAKLQERQELSVVLWVRKHTCTSPKLSQMMFSQCELPKSLSERLPAPLGLV